MPKEKGGHYKLSAKECAMIQDSFAEISHNITKINEYKSQIQTIFEKISHNTAQINEYKSRIQTILEKATPITRPVFKISSRITITDKNIESLLGNNYENSLVYFIDKNKFNRRAYNDFSINWTPEDRRRILEIKKDCRKGACPTPLAIAVMTTEEPMLWGTDAEKTYVSYSTIEQKSFDAYSPDGTVVVATMILKNKQSNEIVRTNWISLGNLKDARDASSNAVSKFVHDALIFSKMRQKLSLPVRQF